MSQISKANLVWAEKEMLKEKFNLLNPQQQEEVRAHLDQAIQAQTIMEIMPHLSVIEEAMTKEQFNQFKQIRNQRAINYWQKRYQTEVLQEQT